MLEREKKKKKIDRKSEWKTTKCWCCVIPVWFVLSLHGDAARVPSRLHPHSCGRAHAQLIAGALVCDSAVSRTSQRSLAKLLLIICSARQPVERLPSAGTHHTATQAINRLLWPVKNFIYMSEFYFNKSSQQKKKKRHGVKFGTQLANNALPEISKSLLFFCPSTLQQSTLKTAPARGKMMTLPWLNVTLAKMI